MKSKNNLSSENSAAKDIANTVENLPTEMQEQVATEVVQNLPEKQQENIIAAITRKKSVQISGNGEFPILLPILDKFDKDHIHKVLDNQRIESEGQRNLDIKKENNKIFFVLLGVGILLVIIFAYWLFKDEKEIINIVNSSLSHIFALIAGAIGGYGYKNKQ